MIGFVILLSIVGFLTVIHENCFKWCLKPLLRLFKEMVYFSYWIRFWLENTLILMVTFSKEIQTQNSSYLIMSIGGILIIGLLGIQMVLNFSSICLRWSFLNGFKIDLNTRRICLILYYLHFYILWISISLFLGIDDRVNSKILWITITSIQCAFSLLHIFKLYSQMRIQFISFLT